MFSLEVDVNAERSVATWRPLLDVLKQDIPVWADPATVHVPTLLSSQLERLSRLLAVQSSSLLIVGPQGVGKSTAMTHAALHGSSSRDVQSYLSTMHSTASDVQRTLTARLVARRRNVLAPARKGLAFVIDDLHVPTRPQPDDIENEMVSPSALCRERECG